ncbi:MAG: VanZ family protein [Eubacterium sp.]|nr:VanZ family protein [Eubacterium sp.]
MTETQLFQARKKQMLDSINWMISKGADAIVPAICIGGFLAILYFIQMRKRKSRIQIAGTAIILMYTVFLMDMTIFSRTSAKTSQFRFVPFMTPGGTHLLLLYALANMIVFVPIGIALKMIRPEIKSYRKVVRFSAIISGVIEVTQFILKCGVCQTEDFLMNILGAIIGWWFCGRILLKKENDEDKNIE